MKKVLLLPLVLIITLMISCNTQKDSEPPDAEKIPRELVNHDHTRIDNYYWMRLSDEQKNAEQPDEQTQKVLDYLNAENEYAENVLSNTKDLADELFTEIKGRIKEADESVPYFDNGYYYYTKYIEGKEYPVYYRKEGTLAADEELLLDVNEIAEGKDYCSVTGLSVSPDNKILAYGTDFVSRRRYTVHFLNLGTGEMLNDKIENTTGRVTWANDSRICFYTGKDFETLRSESIMRHHMGSDSEDDAIVYYEEDEEFTCGIGKTQSEKYLVIFSNQTLTTEARILEADNPQGQFRVFVPREVNHEYSIDHINDKFFIRTNTGDATNFKLMVAPENNFSLNNWEDYIPHRDDVLLQGYTLFDDYIAVSERINALNNIRIINFESDEDYYIDFDEEVYSARISVNEVPESDVLRYTYTSLTTPSSTFDFNMKTREEELLKQTEVLGDFSADNYKSERLWATADDGTQIPISLVYRKGFEQNGQSPLLLYAYGSYGASRDPSFNSAALSLLDRGFAYAIAHIRGGSEMGRQWYEDGKLLNKINTFTDFNDCAEYLIEEDYTSPDRLFAQGGSAGGLLMGAIVNMQPELYKGVLAGVPFVDVVTTMLDASIPLTTFEWDEWGDPREKLYYEYMLSYSPYDQVKEQGYPNMLVTTGFWDSQVQYWEPAKWVAKLRDMKTDDNLLVLKTNMKAGHGGASGRFERLKTTALQYAFIMSLTEE
ncbi:MAG: S9 family peptidase [Bacteroidales bacterium]|nr:S9 family peptidase [Bacteroidales bacterium]